MRCLILVSDEGYGHAVRQSCIANTLADRGADVTFQCRDPIPFIAYLLNDKIKICNQFNLIRLVKQKGGIDVERTYRFFDNYIDKSRAWVRQMANSPHVRGADIIVTDMVEEAGALSIGLSKPVVAVCHFTWHWLLSELDPRFGEVSDYLARNLDGISEFLYLPFSKYPQLFPRARPINLISRTPKPRDEVRSKLGVSTSDTIVLLVGGGTSVWQKVFSSLNIAAEKRIIFFSDFETNSTNIKPLPDPINLHNYINACDLVVSRGGYSTSSEALAYGIKHLILTETNHPETLANGRLLEKANRAVVRDLPDFLNNSYDLIWETLNTSLDVTPIKADGHIQVVDRLYEKWETH